MNQILSFLESIGGCFLFLNKLIHTLIKKPIKIKEVIEQIWRVTVDSAPTTAMAGFFVGAILTVQFTMQLKEFDALGYLGGLATLTLPSIISGLFKCLCFAFVLATICTYTGYTTSGGAKGVGRAVVTTAVATMVTIVVIDWFTTYLGDVALVAIRGYR